MMMIKLIPMSKVVSDHLKVGFPKIRCSDASDLMEVLCGFFFFAEVTGVGEGERIRSRNDSVVVVEPREALRPKASSADDPPV
jgi:hypothetical protein